MNRKSYLILIYHLFFVILSILIVASLEGIRSELFAGVLYFNLVYFFIGGLADIILYFILQKLIYKSKILLLGSFWIGSLIIVNILSYYFNDSMITVEFVQNIFNFNKNNSFFLLSFHIIILSSYFFAIALTTQKMKADTKK